MSEDDEIKNMKDLGAFLEEGVELEINNVRDQFDKLGVTNTELGITCLTLLYLLSKARCVKCNRQLGDDETLILTPEGTQHVDCKVQQ